MTTRSGSGVRVGQADIGGTTAVLGAVTLMGIGSVVAKASDIAGPVLAFHRAWVAAVLYVVLFLALGGRVSRASLRAAAPGGLFFGVQLAFFFSAIQLTTVANATMLIALQPVAVLLFFSKRFDEVVSGSEIAISAVALAGVGLVVFGSTGSPSWSPGGDLLAVGALACWTLYFVASKQARQTVGAVEYQGLSLIFSTAVMLPVAFLFSGTVDAGAGKWWWIPAMVGIPGTGHLLMNWAHSRVPLALVSELTLISPVVSVGLAAAVLDGETVNATQLLGMGVVLAALALLVRPRAAR
ncbi:MAG: EamA family transporter [Actinomycetia bacterium]|nr:EamA family transporter [Actinomycetes bacterium]